MIHVVKYKSVSVSVYSIRRTTGEDYWQFKRADGTQVTRASLERAKRDALKEAHTVFKGGLSIEDLTPDQIRGIKRIIEVDPEMKMVDEFLVWHGRKAPRKNTGIAIDEFLAAKELNRGGSKENVRTLRSHMGALESLRGRTLADIAVNDLPAVVGAARTRKNTRAAWITFFRWAMENEYLPHGEKTAPERLARPVIRRKEPETYSPAQLQLLLAGVSESYAPWLICAAFAGMRAAEICPPKGSGKSPLLWSDFLWDRKIIIIRPETAKTGQRRIIPITPVLAHWLAPYRAESGRVCAESRPPSSAPRKGTDSETTRLGKLIGGWKQNALRHSWISYQAAEIGLAQTAMMAGNSESEAKKSYNSAKSKEEAAEWFSVGL